MSHLTIKHIAQLAGVSPITVSRVINRKPDVAASTAARVREVIEAHNWLPNLQARGLVGGRTLTLGFVTSGVGSSFTHTLLLAAEAVAAEQRYGLLLMATGTSPERARRAMTTLIQRRVDGIVLSGPLPLADDDWVPAREAGIPMVSLFVKRRGIPTFTVNYETAGRLAAAELVRLGHRRCLYVHDSDSLVDEPFTRARWEGFRQGGGHDFQPAPLHQPYGQTAALTERLKRGDITAIFCQNDRCLPDVYRAAWELGLAIPRDLSVIGCNDEPFCRQAAPRASTISLNSSLLATEAVRSLIASYPKPPRRGRLFTPQFVARESTADINVQEG